MYFAPSRTQVFMIIVTQDKNNVIVQSPHPHYSKREKEMPEKECEIQKRKKKTNKKQEQLR